MSYNLSGVFLPVNLSVDMSALTQSADLSGYDGLVQVIYEAANLSDDMVQSLYELKPSNANQSDGIYVSQLLLVKSQHVFAIRNQSTKIKFWGKQGAKAVKTLE